MHNQIKSIVSEIENVDTLILKIEENTLSKSYIRSYNSILLFFAGKILDENTLIQGANMIYGWMPKTLNISKFQIDLKDILAIVNDQDLKINQNNLNQLMKFMNNSLVGASKLLHFLHPDRYPIWDSKVCEKLMGCQNNKKVNTIKNYIDYYNAISELKNLPNCMTFKEAFKLKYKYEISDIRAIELIIFLSNE
jgi:hypothetical protein